MVGNRSSIALRRFLRGAGPAVALSSASLLVSGSAAAQWSPEIPLTSTNSDIWGEGIATSGTTVHVVYGTSDVLYRRSKDEGATFEPEKALDTGVIHLTDPMVADGNDVWTIYLKNLQSKTDWCCARDLGDIYLLHSGDGGDSWDAPKRLTTAQGAFRVSIAYAANQLHLVWMDFRDNVWDTYYLHSPDRGATWDAEKVIAASAGVFGAERPQVAARGDEVHVTIWDDRGQNPTCMAGPFTFTVCPDTFYTRSLDGGATWGPIVPVAYSGAAFAGRNDIAVSGSSSVIVNFNRDMPGTADANPHMFSVRSADNGVTWDDPVQLTTSDGSSDHGSIIGDSTSVYLAWHDGRSGQLAIYFRGSKTEGATYEPEEKVSTPTDTEASTPLVSLSDNYVHVLWLDKRTGPNQIFTRRRELLMPDPGTGGGGSGGVGGAGIGGDAANGAGGSGMSGGGGGASGGSGGGGGDSGAESGCDCRTTGQSRTADSMMFAALAAVGLGVHRRRVRRARG